MSEQELQHYGILGMHWGVRRFQNEDGSLTSAGKKRYDTEEETRSKHKKVAVGVAVGVTATAGVALTAYLLKKYSGKSVASITKDVDAGKTAVEELLKDTKVSSAPVSTLTSTVKATTQGIPKTYDFATLMQQNDDLLQSMYADLLR